MAQRGSNSFNEEWLSGNRFKDWIVKESSTSVKCRWCKIVIRIKNMGVSALTSHSKYRKHQNVQNGFAEGKFARLCFKPTTEPLVVGSASLLFYLLLCIFVQGRWQLIQIYSVDWRDVYDTTQYWTQNRTSKPLKYQRTTNTTATLVVKY